MTFERTNDSPFARSDVLAEDYIPDEILGRNEELEQITEVLQQIIDDERPVNAFIYGISGTGKTVSVKFKRKQLEGALDRYDDVHATFVYQNCESLSSSYQTAISITNEFLDDPRYEFLHEKVDLDRDRLPSSGLPKERVYDVFFDALDELTYRNTTYRSHLAQAFHEVDGIHDEISLRDVRGDSSGTSSLPDGKRERILAQLHETHDITPPEVVTNYVTVILDEVDRIGSQDELLYEIPRSRTNGRIENVFPSIIGISNDIGYKGSIRSKTDSSLRLKEITFKKYDTEELQQILEQRAENAFKAGAYDDEIIPLAAAFARKQGGDARYGIDLLQKAGMKAKKEGTASVTEEHVRRAHEEKERDRVYEVTKDLSDHEKLVLAAVTLHDCEGRTPSSRSEIYPAYKEFAHELLGNTNVSRRVADYLKEMSQLGLLNRKDAYNGPGESGFKYHLGKVDAEMVNEVLRGTDQINDDPAGLLPEKLARAIDE